MSESKKAQEDYMKKQLLLAGLVLSFALSTGAYAQQQPEGGCPLKDAVKKECPQKFKRPPLKRNHHIKHKRFDKTSMETFGYAHHVQKNRATVYNALNLSDDQIKLREDLLKENSPIYNRKFKELNKESHKLKALKGAGASDKEIARQKKVVKNTKKDIKKLMNEENKIFKKSLTREQRSKYSMIKKLEEKDYKNASHKKDYYKSNPKMVPFGDPKKIKPCPKFGEIPTPRPVLPPTEVK